ncbi:formate dehydrogenase subunit beta [Bosea sp. TWI1241]|jgi:formate dehydrogenase iron-sulfur subunit|uniref:formate dehydrogenase subunit beta n=1 Tax=Bosea sp. TWI1241 TaxID=3148904 RepID=UPI003208D0B1
MANAVLEIARQSATRGGITGALAPQDDFQLVKLIDVSKCIGCKACQSACLEWNDLREPVGINVGVYDNPHDLTENSWTLMRFTEWDNPQTGRLEWLIRKDGCMHCADPGCLKACPAPGAIVQYTNGIVDFQKDHCIGCGYCIKGCPFNIPRISKATEKAYKCTLCVDRVAVGQGPACAKACPTKAISFGTETQMKQLAASRITDLKSRGYQNAGLYDPPGVGGTHVMYVLHHNDQPQLYAGLPKDARISPVVEVWKGMTKYAGLAVMGLAAAVGLIHHTVVGANRVTEHDEVEGEKIKEGKA